MKNRLPLFFIAALLSLFGGIAFGQSQYNIYYGDIHSHTWYSDGNKDQDTNTYKKPVARAITYARDVANDMDFLGVSEHNHNEGLNMKLSSWRSGHLEADSVNQDGTFVGLYGQEWGTISTGGHVLIYGTTKLYGWNPGLYDVFIAKGDYTSLYPAVKSDGGFMYLAHPNSGDFDGYFSSYHASWDSVVSGIAMKSGPALVAIYNESDPDNGSYEGLFHTALKLGYHVAPCGNQDNHYTNFGMVNQQRTAVLATSLTKANILDGLRNRHTYATEDHNLQVRFESGTRIMGDIYTTSGNVPLRVKVSDPDNSITSIVIRYGIPGGASTATTLTSVSSVDSLIFSQPQAVNTTYYYYAYVTNNSGRHAWTAPIWVTTTASSNPPAAFDLSSPANNAVDRTVSGTLSWSASAGATGYDVYLGTTSPGTLVSSNQAGTTYNYAGLSNSTAYFWKVVAKNGFGNTDASTAPWTFTTVMAAPSAFALSSPSTGSTNQAVSGTLSWAASSGASGYTVYLGTSNPPTTAVSTNQAGTTYNYSGLSNSTTHYWKVVATNVGGSTTSTAAPWNFATIVAAPTAFAQSSPAGGATNQALSGTLSWAASANAATYDVYLDSAANPTTLVSADQAGTTYNYSGLANARTYRWKVVAKNVASTVVATNAPLSFTTVVSAPSAFALLSPSNSAASQPRAGTLVWAASPNAAAYDVYLDAGSATTLVSADQADTSYAYSGLLGGTTYSWKVVAKNPGGSVASTGSPYQFTTVSAPAGATGLVVSNVTASSLQIDWTDAATDETGYRVYHATSPSGPWLQLGTDLPPNTTSATDIGLGINERMYYRIAPFNGAGEAAFAEIDAATLAVAPGSPVLQDATYSSLRIIVNPSLNPAATEFAIAVEFDTLSLFAQTDGSVGPDPAWQTYAAWGGSGGTVISGLRGCKTYTLVVWSRNLDEVDGGSSEADQIGLQCFSLASNVASGWNLVSLPVNLPDQSRSTVFPTSTSAAFGYQGGYQQRDTLAHGYGYWLKFNGPDPVELVGEPGLLDSIPVQAGWNIVGSVATPVGVGTVTSVPPGIVSSSFYGYDGAYSVADSIRPLRGYWVKANAPGTLIVSTFLGAPAKTAAHVTPETAPAVAILTFTNGRGESRTLRLLADGDQAEELPPTPPAGIFDVRYGSQRDAEHLVAGKSLPIEVQSAGEMDLHWEIAPDADQRLELLAGTEKIVLSRSGSVRLPAGTSELILRGSAPEAAVPAAYALHQNYPNPFNPSTEIRYDLPVRSAVRLTVYSLLGTPVATLVDGQQEPGYHSVTWRPELSSGVYLYRLEAASFENPGTTFQKIFRMLLLK